MYVQVTKITKTLGFQSLSNNAIPTINEHDFKIGVLLLVSYEVFYKSDKT